MKSVLLQTLSMIDLFLSISPYFLLLPNPDHDCISSTVRHHGPMFMVHFLKFWILWSWSIVENVEWSWCIVENFEFYGHVFFSLCVLRRFAIAFFEISFRLSLISHVTRAIRESLIVWRLQPAVIPRGLSCAGFSSRMTWTRGWHWAVGYKGPYVDIETSWDSSLER